MSEIDPRRYLLSEQEARRIFAEEIVPEKLARGVAQADPVVVFVAGQPGAGKTLTTSSIADRLDDRGGCVVVNSDFYKPFHPEYNRLMAEDDRNAAPYTSLDGRRWMGLAEQHLITVRSDVLIETTMRDPGDFLEPAQMFRDAGYRVETAIMAVPEPLSRLGIVHRYHDQVKELGHGRLTAQSNHDASYHGVVAAAEAIDRDRIVDAAVVLRRGNEQLTMNSLDEQGQWVFPDRSIAEAIVAERQRPWTPEETAQFTKVTTKLFNEMGPQWHGELREISELATPLMQARQTEARLAVPGLPRPDEPAGQAIRDEAAPLSAQDKADARLARIHDQRQQQEQDRGMER